MTRKDGALFGPSTSPHKSLHSPKNEEKSPGKFRYDSPTKRREKVPSKDERPVYGIQTHKNFIVANAVEAILQGKKADSF